MQLGGYAMNVIGMLKPKCSTTYLHDTDSLRDGLHIMRESGYTAVPVIGEDGKYVGTVREGDWKNCFHPQSQPGGQPRRQGNLSEPAVLLRG